MENTITIYGLSGSNIAYFEAKGFSKVLMAYADECVRLEIMELGFNPNSGYVYLALECGIQICSLVGSDVEYLVTDTETGEEYFLDSMHEAEIKLDSLNQNK
jgi:hypothetical protein